MGNLIASIPASVDILGTGVPFGAVLIIGLVVLFVTSGEHPHKLREGVWSKSCTSRRRTLILNYLFCLVYFSLTYISAPPQEYKYCFYRPHSAS